MERVVEFTAKAVITEITYKVNPPQNLDVVTGNAVAY
jgi:hypothetical protein